MKKITGLFFFGLTLFMAHTAFSQKNYLTIDLSLVEMQNANTELGTFSYTKADNIFKVKSLQDTVSKTSGDEALTAFLNILESGRSYLIQDVKKSHYFVIQYNSDKKMYAVANNSNEKNELTTWDSFQRAKQELLLLLKKFYEISN